MDGIFQHVCGLSVYMWPGLGRIWRHGAFLGLVSAFGFTLLLSAALMSSVIWNEWLPDGVRVLLWFLTGLYWTLGWVDSNRFLANHQFVSARDGQLDLFLAARGEYLRCKWKRAEDLLCSILHENPRDVEARLMMATLSRHQGLPEEAREHLRRLQRLERASDWNMEIEREWRLLSRLKTSGDLDESVPDGRPELVTERSIAA